MNKPLSQNKINNQNPKGDSKAAIEFLKGYAPKIAIVLTAIVPDGGTTTATFLPNEMAKCEKWINSHMGKKNIYFTVNPTIKPLNSKASKKDIAALAWLHVDIDPEPGKNLTTERTRILKLLEDYIPKPTLVIDSGGGYQAFWKLDVVQQVTPSGDNIPELEAYNKQLEIILKADACHNIDRIMRLPGTINIPNKSKKAKGRKEALAKVEWFDEKLVYSIATFSKAASVGPAPQVNVELGNVPDSVDLNELGISQDLKGLIQTGEHPDNPEKYKSRSEAVFGMIFSLISANCTDGRILRVLLNPEFKISESILEKSNPEKYAIRQIERAKYKKASNFHLTDLGNSKRLVYHYGDTLRYIPPQNSWLHWDSNRWVCDEDGKIDRIAKSTILKIYQETLNTNDVDRQRVLIAFGRKSENVARIKAVVQLAKTEPLMPIQPKELDTDSWLLGLPNGTLNLKTLQLQIPDKEDYITKLGGTEYDPDAKCPTWLKFLQRIMDENDNLINFLQTAVGYCLTGSTKEQVLFFLHGTGSNGKGVFQSTISTLLGDYSTQVSADTFMIKNNQQIPNDIARLRGARFIATSEIEDGQKMAESLVKQMTGQDTIVARFLNKEFFEYTPNFKIWIAANHKPIIRGNDHAIWRRIILIPFSVTILKADQDHDLILKLKKELPGILNWALDGCKQWQEQGLNPPEEVVGATREYRDDMDIFGPWIKERCIVRKDAHCLSKVLYADYRAWAERNLDHPFSQQRWGRKMTERGFIREYTPQVRYQGITLDFNEDF